MRATMLIAKQFLGLQVRNRTSILIYIVWVSLVVYASYTGFITYADQNRIRTGFQQQARQSWEANPDKHPHRMAHFGSFAFRIKHPLSMFDYGMESYTGTAVYLEAHKQNTVNFSEASFSTGLLRFGEISLSMLVYTVLSLILFFLGFGTVAQQRENSTLKILLSQGCTFRQIITGYSIGLFLCGLLFLVPVFIATTVQQALAGIPDSAQTWERAAVLWILILLYTWVISVLAVSVSALSASSRSSLIKLLGLWLLMTIVVPKTLQAIGSAAYPAPGKIQFQSAVEAEILAIGDSHNPNDPHFRQLKDSVLKAHNADSIQQLPFNYSGFQMREGERLSAEVYNRHLQQLYNRYDLQNSFSYGAAFFDPTLAIKNVSMSLSGTDFSSYRYFQQEAEAYRYHLAQSMNELQIEHISNSYSEEDEEPHSLEKHYWKEFPDFEYRYPPLSLLLVQQQTGILALVCWMLVSWILIYFTAANAKAL